MVQWNVNLNLIDETREAEYFIHHHNLVSCISSITFSSGSGHVQLFSVQCHDTVRLAIVGKSKLYKIYIKSAAIIGR